MTELSKRMTTGFFFGLFILRIVLQRPSSSADREQEISIEMTTILPAAGCDQGVPKSNMAASPEHGPVPVCIGGQPADELPPRTSGLHGDGDAEYGTVIVLSVSQQKVMIAADSRATIVNGNGEVIRSNDDACKVVELNSKMLFAVDGMAETGRNLPVDIYFDSRDLARAAVRSFEFDPLTMEQNATVRYVAEKWGWDVDYRIRRGLEQGALRIAPTWLEGIFAGIEPNGEISVAVASLRYGKPQLSLIVPPVILKIDVLNPPKQYTWIEAYGIRDVATGYIFSRSQSDSSKAKHVALRKEQLGEQKDFSPKVLVDLVNATRDSYPNSVNGPVDLASLSRQGNVQWLDRKPVCVALWGPLGIIK